MKELNQFQSEFQNLNFGTTVTTSEYQNIEVEIDPHVMMDDYAIGLVHDLERRNPIRFDTVSKQLQSEGYDLQELFKSYVSDLARLRVQMVKRTCKVFREAKLLGVPPYVQFALSQIGMIYDPDHGKMFTPSMNEEKLELTMDQMFKATEVLRTFESDGVVSFYDAFPRDQMGDRETMSFAIIDGFVKSPEKFTHPAKSYIAVFLGMKLRQESELKALYSVRYDNIDFVKRMLMQELMKC